MALPRRPEVQCSVAGPTSSLSEQSEASPGGPVAPPSHGSAGP